jgi:serine protease Do
LIQRATDGGPAAGAGLRQGDVLYSVNGTVVSSPNGLQNLIAQKRPRDEVTVRIYRNGSPRDVQIRLGEADFNQSTQPQPEAEHPAAEEKLGIGVGELTDELASRWGFENPGGVIISEVTPLGPAARRLVPPGVKILEIDGESVQTPDDVKRILGAVDSGDVVSLRLGYPDGTTRIVNVRTAG